MKTGRHLIEMAAQPPTGRSAAQPFFDCLTRLARLLLDLADQLVVVALRNLEIVVRELAPGLFRLGDELIPPALPFLRRCTLHDNLPLCCVLMFRFPRTAPHHAPRRRVPAQRWA